MALKDVGLGPVKKVKTDLLAGLSDDELMTLRHDIDKKLRVDLTKLNLSDELGLQFRAGQILLASVQDDDSVPANQRSQVLNSVSSALEKIVKQQKVVYDAERLKRFESAWLRVMEELPLESQKKFFLLYGEYLKQAPPGPEAEQEAA